jgi:hypothetical protein
MAFKFLSHKYEAERYGYAGYNPSPWEVEIGGLKFRPAGQKVKTLVRPYLKEQARPPDGAHL